MILPAAARAIVAEGGAFLSRVHRVLRARHVWSRAEEQFSPLGVEPRNLDQILEELLREGCSIAGDPHPERAVLLPGLEIRGGRIYYAEHYLGPADRALESAWRAQLDGDRSIDLAPLVRAGLAVGSRPEVRAKRWALVVVPHRDDAALALGGTLFARRHQERALIVDTFTVSVWLGEGLRPRPLEQVTRLRAREEELSARVLGARALGLGFWDVDCRSFARAAREGYRIPESFRWKVDPLLRPGEERSAIAAAILRVAQRIAPARIYLPLGAGGHADHQLLREISIELADQFSGAQIYFYEDQPYSTYSKVDVAAIARATSIAGRALEPELVDVTAAFERKLQAIAAHRSQFRRDENEQRLRAYAARCSPGEPSGGLAERIWRAPASS